MHEAKIWYINQKVNRTLVALEKNGFKAFFTSTRSEALEKVLSLIPLDARVGIGGSVTIREINLIEALSIRGNTVFQHWQQTKEDTEAILKQELNSDVFLSSSNAITEDGKLVNIDGGGNRVAAMIFGPKKVILVVGINKIVKDVDEAIKRVKNIAAPMNARRLGYKIPCAITGTCIECDEDNRMCRVTTIIEKKPTRNDITVIIVGEELGF